MAQQSRLRSIVYMMLFAMFSSMVAADYHLAVIAQLEDEGDDPAHACEPFTDRIDQAIENKLVGGQRRSLRGLFESQAHCIYHCNEANYGLSNGVCYYFTEGYCGSQRALEHVNLETSTDTYPQWLHDDCIDKKPLMEQGIWAATEDPEVSQECRAYLSGRWKVFCMVSQS